LKAALAERFRDVMEEHQVYLAEHADRSRAARAACLAPCEDGERSLLLRWETIIGREIERKMMLYLLMRRRDRRTTGEENTRKK
jgi:hypothetical protein